MLNSELHLSDKIFKRDIEKVSCREGWGGGLVIAGEKDDRVVVLSSDVAGSTKASLFAEKFPERFIQVGVAEQVLATVASGMANYGKIPFISAYAIFSPGRNWEQIRTTIALNNVPVIIGGSHAGLSVGPDGATHQALEDIALMRVLPNMIVIAPCDAVETKKAVLAVLDNGKPAYIRFAREKTPIITTEDTPFKIGKAEVYFNSMLNAKCQMLNVSIVVCGPIIYEALLAARELEENGLGVEVINCHTIKPIDEQAIIHAAKISGAIVTVEEHQVTGGLGSAVSEVLSKNYPVPIEMIGMQDKFGESGKPDELLEKYKMSAVDIIYAVKKAITRKEN